MAIPRALRYLFPNAVPLRDYEVRDDGAGAYIAVWRLEAPQPTTEELAQADRAAEQAEQTAATEAAQLRQQVLTIAQSAVGVRIDALTAAQVRALVAVLLWRGGALRPDGTVRPLAEWATRG